MAIVILTSCRRDFDNPDHFGPRAFESAAGYDDLVPLICIHGYNSDRVKADASYRTIAAGLGRAVTGELWPGGDKAVEYPLAVMNATKAGWRLQDLIAWFNAMGVKPSIQTHSLGARVALEALRGGFVDVATLILCAPAVDDDCLGQNGEFEDVPPICDSVHVFHSRGDEVLRKWYPLGDLDGHDRALGYNGPSGAVEDNVHVWDCSARITDHSQYRDCTEYIVALKRILDGDEFGARITL